MPPYFLYADGLTVGALMTLERLPLPGLPTSERQQMTAFLHKLHMQTKGSRAHTQLPLS